MAPRDPQHEGTTGSAGAAAGGSRSALKPVIAVGVLLLLLVTAVVRWKSPPVDAPVFAVAASLRVAMPALEAAFRAQGGPGLKITYGATGDLKRQLEAGAPIDGVLFASAAPVEQLVASGHLTAESRRQVATNRLVLIGPLDAPPLTFATLEQLPAGERLAIGEPGAVPAGQYAVQALQKLGKWDALQGRLVYGGDVGAVLAYARRHEVPAAITYATDARGIPEVKVLDEAVGDWAPTPRVVAGLSSASKNPAAQAFLELLTSAEGQKLLQSVGFGPP